MENDTDNISPKKKFNALVGLFILVAIGGIILYGKHGTGKAEQPPIKNIPLMVGPTSPPPTSMPINGTKK